MLKNLAVLFISIVLCLLTLEGVTRIFWLNPQKVASIGFFKFVNNPKVIYEFIPGASVDGSTINKQGYKDFDFVARKADDEVRIIMLGDSITAGMHVPLERTFSKRLEYSLNQKAIKARIPARYNVMNFGVNGYNLEACIETLKAKSLRYSPDVVILNLFYRDIEPIPNLWWFFIDERGPDEHLKSFILRKYFHDNSFATDLKIQLLRHSRLFLFIVYRIQALQNQARTISFIRDRFQKENGVFDCGDAGIIRDFRELAKLKNQHNFKVLLCIHPFLNLSEHPVNDRFERIAKEFDFPYFKIIDYYRKEKLSKDSLKISGHQDDICHPNELGHEIIAEAMFNELRKRGFINQNL